LRSTCHYWVKVTEIVIRPALTGPKRVMDIHPEFLKALDVVSVDVI